MKNFILPALALIVVVCTAWQTTSSSTPMTYCEIIGTQRISTGMQQTIYFNFGIGARMSGDMKDATGKAIVMNTNLDAINYLGGRGWHLSQAYAVSYNANNTVFRTIMMKPTADLTAEEKGWFDVR